MPAWGADARYERLVATHRHTLLRLAYLLTGSSTDAEDAMQDAIISVAQRWSVVREATAVAYLKRAVTNAALDLIRRRHDIPTDVVPEASVDDPGLLRHEEDQAFFAIVRTLPERQRAVLVLRYYADIDDRTIARMLGITHETVRSQASRALATLRESEVLR